jgi:hypothetical protein
MTFAKGNKALGECGRCGKQVLLRHLIEDGFVPGLLVERRCWEPTYPAPVRTPIEDPIAVENPSPCLDKVGCTITFPNYDVVNDRTNSPLALTLNLGLPVISVINAITENFWITHQDDWMVTNNGDIMIFNG